MSNNGPNEEQPRIGAVGFVLVVLATATLITVLGSLIGFYDWMWYLMVVGVGGGFWVAIKRGS